MPAGQDFAACRDPRARDNTKQLAIPAEVQIRLPYGDNPFQLFFC